ncbi:uncharacterized protein LOC100576603 [Apis mellifera]|uniref:Uncharacterized protein LOC100576603 n=1 Tax=Apis mellifera TaxID=7460 RepID=A0A7M7GR56_APIME|nr:uncharacterized protein LOC100576603 [Apis mellifera]|eukprot:XP_006559838.1 uncharacterized protein LOC100576603 [Apis mellifera]
MYEKRRTRGRRLERLEKERKDEGERRRISTARRRGNKTKGRKEILRILPRLSSTISASVLVIVLVDVHGLQRSAIRVASPWKPGGLPRSAIGHESICSLILVVCQVSRNGASCMR